MNCQRVISDRMMYEIGGNGDNNLIDLYESFNESYKDKVIGVFGAAPTSSIGASREPARLVDSPKEKIFTHLKYAKGKGFKVDYLFNSCIEPKGSDEDTCKEISEVIEEINPDIVTVGNERVLQIISKQFSDLPINASVVLGIKDVKGVEEIIDKYGVSRITLQQDTNRNWKELEKIIKIAQKAGVQIEILANELCIYNCPVMHDHYVALSKAAQFGEKDDPQYEAFCNNKRKEDSLEFINAPWIRPEDVQIYEDLGVDILKIAGRDKPSGYLRSVVEAFIKRKHKGNVMDLFSETWWPNGKKPYLDSRKLDGLIEMMKKEDITHFKKKEDVPEKYWIDYSKSFPRREK